MKDYNYIPVCKIVFKGYLKDYGEITLGAFNVCDMIRGMCANYPDFERDVWTLDNQGKKFVVRVNKQFNITSLEDATYILPYALNDVEFTCVDDLQGKDILPIALGVGLIALAFTGVGILGISGTTFGLLGATLVASTIFKSPKVKAESGSADKKSNNFTGVVNTVGGGQPLPLVFGEAWIGSIVASAYIYPEERAL